MAARPATLADHSECARERRSREYRWSNPEQGSPGALHDSEVERLVVR